MWVRLSPRNCSAELSHGFAGVIRPENGGPGDEDVGAGVGAVADVVGPDAPVDLDQRLLADQGAQAAQLVERLRQERLAAPARGDGPAEDQLDVLEDPG